MMDKRFWNNKRVLITGFEGFLGSHLTKALFATNAKIIGVDIRTNRKETILSKADYKDLIVYQGSVADAALLKKILRTHRINIIFHLAAEAIVGSSQKDPVKAFESNIQGTWTVLEAARCQGKVQALVVASSDKAYGSHAKLPYREEAPLVAKHPYDVSKSCADLIACTYFHTFQLPVAITRCGNIYGPGDFNFSRLIPDAMKSLALCKTLMVRSDGKYVRDYVYIDDIVSGYLRIAEVLSRRKLAGQAFNLSDEKPMTVIDLLKKIDRYYPSEQRLKFKVLDVARYEIKKQYLCAKKARRVLGWRPRYSLSEGLRRTAEWYAGYFCRNKVL